MSSALACQQADASDGGDEAIRSPATLVGAPQRGWPEYDSTPTRRPERSGGRGVRLPTATVMPALEAAEVTLGAAPWGAAGADVGNQEQGERAHPTPLRGAGGRRSHVS